MGWNSVGNHRALVVVLIAVGAFAFWLAWACTARAGGHGSGGAYMTPALNQQGVK